MTSLLALGVTAAGCAADAPNVGDDDDGGGSGSGSGSETVPLTAEGKYKMTSTFDVATNMPGTAGAVINQIIDATDSADDPTHWILDQLVAQLPSGSFKNTVQQAIPFVSGYLNDRLLDVAPDFVVTIRDMGNKFGQIARNFGTLETLEVGANGQATKTVTGVHFVVDQLELDYAFADYGVQPVSVPSVVVQLEPTGRLSIGEHKVPLAYGKVLRIALDEMVIPMIDPSAVTLEDVLKNVVNCHAVGQYTYDALGIGSPSTFESACLGGLKAGANAIYNQMGKVDSVALEFGLTGIAKGVDKNHDGKLDQIQTGAWTGTLAYGGAGAPLAAAKFVGERM
ncbi:MAG TPA: hypothetical protein VFV99_17735 [Kofleriaceae bacterium]|nr:hypothetical protein [Kofleriaceae bacterium]